MKGGEAVLSQLIKPVVYLKGVGPAKAEKYERLGVKTVYDLLCDYPRDYLDLTQPVAINDAPANEQALIKGRIFKKLQPAMIRRGLTIYRAAVTDDTADLTIVIYNTGYAFDRLEVGREYLFLGKLSGNMVRKEMNSPLIFDAATSELIQPVYHLTEGMTQQTLRQNMSLSLSQLPGVRGCALLCMPLRISTSPEMHTLSGRRRKGSCSMSCLFCSSQCS